MVDMFVYLGVVILLMVGMVYFKLNLDSENFVKVGDNVKQGDIILLVEVMKIFNLIMVEKFGKIVEFFVEDGQLVEYGELFFIFV